MSWFSGKANTIRLPFSEARIFDLPGIFNAAIARGLRMRSPARPEATMDIVLSSAFMNAYVCGYPRVLEELDERLGGPVRFRMLAAIFEVSEIEAQWRFDNFRRLLEERDEETWLAFRVGEGDGEGYFRALIDQRSLAKTPPAI